MYFKSRFRNFHQVFAFSRASRPRSNSVPAGVSHHDQLPSSFSHLYRDNKTASQPFTLGLATQVWIFFYIILFFSLHTRTRLLGMG